MPLSDQNTSCEIESGIELDRKKDRKKKERKRDSMCELRLSPEVVWSVKRLI